MKKRRDRNNFNLLLSFITFFFITLLSFPAYPQQIPESKCTMFDQAFWTFIAALAAAIAAIFIGWSAFLTRKTIRANLLSHVLEKYSSEEMFRCKRILGDYRQDFSSLGEMKENYEKLCTFPTRTERWGKVDFARNHVSAFFWEIKAYCGAGYLDKEMIAAAIGRSGHQMYLEIVEPLDRINTKNIPHSKDYDESVRAYFEGSLKNYFS